MVNTIWFWVDWTRIYLRFLLNKPKSDCIYRIPMVICILNFMLQKITTTYALKSPIVLILSWLKHKAFTNLLLNVVPDLVEVGGLGREPPLLLCRQGCHTAGQAYQQPRYETLHLNRNTNMLRDIFLVLIKCFLSSIADRFRPSGTDQLNWMDSNPWYIITYIEYDNSNTIFRYYENKEIF